MKRSNMDGFNAQKRYQSNKHKQYDIDEIGKKVFKLL